MVPPRITQISDSLREFSGFLLTDQYLDYRFSGADKPKCLLDIIDFWIGDGKGIDVFSTFESFLLTVIDIIGDWVELKRTWIDHVPLWPEKRDYDEEAGEDWVDAPGEQIEFAFMPNKFLHMGDAFASAHAVLNPVGFALQKAKREQERHQELIERLDRLTSDNT